MKALERAKEVGINQAADEFKLEIIKEMLVQTRGNITHAADTLGINRGTVRTIAKRLGVRL